MDKKNTEYSLGDLRKKSKTELLDLLYRQEKLLSNARFIAKLPDKGQKIKNLKDQVKQTLSHLNDISRVTDDFHQLQLNSKPTNHLDSDDDNDESPEQEVNVYKTLATNGLQLKQYKDVRRLPNERIEDVPDMKTDNRIHGAEINNQEPISVDLQKFSSKLTKKIATVNGEKSSERFRENRTLQRTLADALPNKTVKSDKLWYDTSVTPPPSKFTSAKLISLQESYSLITEQTQKAKELAIKQATEQLAKSIYSGVMEESNFVHYTNYREVHSEGDSEDED